MAAASATNRKFKNQNSFREKPVREVNSIAALLPEKKEWCAEYGLQMLMLNG
jgi:hypothetical protein